MNPSAAMHVALEDLPVLDDAQLLTVAEHLVLEPVAAARHSGAAIFKLLGRIHELNERIEGYKVALANVTDDPPHSGTATSKAAANSVRPIVNPMRRQILKALGSLRSEGGGTADRIELVANMKGNSVRPRLIEMETLGWVVRNGDTRKTRSGRDASVWRITVEGHAKLTEASTKEKP